MSGVGLGRSRLRAVTALLVLATSCSVGVSAPPSDTQGNTAPPPAVIDWSDPRVRADFPGGWSIGKCDGDAPLLCVERGGTGVGIVEAHSYPVDSFDALDPAADDASNLRAFASSFIDALAADRAVGCGSDYRFDPLTATPFDLGDAEGVSYGYTGTMADGAASELNLQFAVIRGDTVVLITAIAYDEGGCPGRDDASTFTSAELAAFRPHLERVLSESPLPPSPG